MKLTLSQIVNSQEALSTLLSDKLIPYRLGWRIARIVREISPELEKYQKDYNALCRVYGEETDPKGCGKWNVLEKNFSAFQDELKPFLEKEVEVDVIPIPLDLFNFAPDSTKPTEKYHIPPVIILNLDWAFLEPTDDIENGVPSSEPKEPRKRHG